VGVHGDKDEGRAAGGNPASRGKIVGPRKRLTEITKIVKVESGDQRLPILEDAMTTQRGFRG